MRVLKRWLRRLYAEWRIAPRRREIAKELQHHFSLSSSPQLTRRGSRGHDSIYLVSHAGKNLGMLRLVNPYNKRPLPPADMPFRLEEAAGQINREWNAYTKGAPFNLTPKPLWRAQDALVCSYVAAKPLHDILLQSPERAWELLLKGAAAVAKLHEAGLTHMDASLANMLSADEGRHVTFIDFEYAPAQGLPPAAQRLYDHLRLLESSWKLIHKDEQKNILDWCNFFSRCLDDEMKSVDLNTIKPGLSRIFTTSDLVQEIHRQMAQ